MDISIEHVEHLTSQQLRQLPTQHPEDDDIYAVEGVLNLEDNDEISPGEGGFMMGYLEAEAL